MKSFIKKEPLGFAALVVMVVLFAGAFGLPLLLDLDPYTNHLDERLQSASAKYPLGTDQNGRDVFSRIVYGGRTSFIIGILSTGAAFFIGVSLGLLSGFRGGALDLAVVQLTDISFAVPSLLLAIAAASIMPPGVFPLVLALTLSGWGSFARIARSAAKQIAASDYVLAARSLGASVFQVLLRHILPNSLSLLIVTATLKMGSFVLGEAALSFLGLGLKAPEPSWGGMVSDSTRFLDMRVSLSLVPGIMIALLVMSFNLFGEGLRDFYDVRKDA